MPFLQLYQVGKMSVTGARSVKAAVAVNVPPAEIEDGSDGHVAFTQAGD